MATSGSFTTTSYEGRSLTFSWNRTNYSVANNTSTIAWSVKGSGSYTGGWVTCGDIDVVVNGTTVYNSTAENRINVWSGDVVASGTMTIAHDANGNKTFSASVKAAVYNYAQNVSGSGNFTLNNIPRAASIDKVANTGGTSITSIGTGNAIRVYFTPKSTAFKYRVTVSMNGEWVQNDAAGVSVTSTAQTYYQSGAIPHSWIPNATSGTLTCKLETLNGTTVIGTSTKTITINVPTSVVPTISSLTINPYNTNSVINGWGIYVANYSKARLACAASGASGSTIKKFTISNAASATINGTSMSYDTALSTGGSKTFTVVATDSRGRNSAAKSVTINVVNYYTPAIASFSVVRTDSSGNVSDSGTAAKLSFSGTYTNIGSNAATAKFFYKLSTATTYTAISTTSAGSAGKINGGIVVNNVTFATASEYDFQMQITDSMGNTVSRTVRLGTVTRTMNIAKFGNGVAIGKMSTITAQATAGKFECGWDADFDKNVNVDGAMTIAGAANINGITTTRGRIYSNDHIYLGGNFESTGEKHLKFVTNPNGTYQHHIYLFGADPNATNALGCYDAINNRVVFAYDDRSNTFKIGNSTTININGGNLKDFVVEQGTSGIWTYKKWFSGTVECWGNVSVNPTTANAINSVTVNLPFTFANTDFVVTATPAKCGLLVDRCGDCNASNSMTHTTSSFVLSYNYAHGTIYTTSFNVIVKGDWK